MLELKLCVSENVTLYRKTKFGEANLDLFKLLYACRLTTFTQLNHR